MPIDDADPPILPSLEGVDLEDSWVLGWELDSANQRLTVQIEASLWKPHRLYRMPRPGDWTYYTRARLVFNHISSITGLVPQAQARPSTNANGEVDFDCIYGLRLAGGGYAFEGEMGNVLVQAKSFQLIFEEDEQSHSKGPAT